jgi:hypothetical protein
MVEECRRMNGMGPTDTCSVCEAHVGWRSKWIEVEILTVSCNVKTRAPTLEKYRSAGFELGVFARPWIWWKCFVVAERLVHEVWTYEYGLDIEERRNSVESVGGW